MGGDTTRSITDLLGRWSRGEPKAADELLPLVYDELRRLASRKFRGGGSPTLQPTLLVHDAFLRLSAQEGIAWKGRSHFYGVAARAMRQVLADYLRYRWRQKRGSEYVKVQLIEADGPAAGRTTDVLALAEALDRLEELDPDKARVVELRYFAGLTIDETAAALSVSPAAVVRRWRRARAWLYAALTEGAGADGL